jgi:hypothetical protein
MGLRVPREKGASGLRLFHVRVANERERPINDHCDKTPQE